jgi:trk system potassium uptake protein TrkH
VTPPGDGATLRRIDAAMAVAALTAFGALVVEHGFRPAPAVVAALHAVNAACALAFAGLQGGKLLAVARPREYLRAHRIDFVLLFVALVQIAVHVGLRATPELRYFESRGLPSPLTPLYVGALQAYLVAIVVLRSPLLHRFLVRLRLRPVQILVVSFGLLIAAGTIFLALPGASAQGRSLGAIDALFTATSAVCVTGLVIRDTGVDFSPLGITVIGLLIQAGGLGIITLTTSFALFGGTGLRGEEAKTLARTMDAASVSELRSSLGRIVAVTFAIEAAGTAALWLSWSQALPDPWLRAGWAAFHAISAFCNAGFALFAGNASLTAFTGDPFTCLTIAALIVLGGLGIPVVIEVGRWAVALRRTRRTALTRHARWVLAASAALIAFGALAFGAYERSGALAGLAAFDAALAALFQSVSLRTAGFNSVPLGALALPTVALCIVWMLIGGSPMSAAGGAKTTTVLGACSWLTGRPRLDAPTARRAARLLAAFAAAFAGLALSAALAQGAWDRRLAFEVASALGTVGLTMDYTDELTTAGKLVICVAMFAGRVGPFALAASILPLREETIEPPGRAERVLLG